MKGPNVSGSSSPASDLVKSILLQWKFEPKILDGKHVQVVTEFMSQVGGLTKIPD